KEFIVSKNQKRMNMKKTLKLALACFAAAFQLSASAAVIVDQEQPSRLGGFCYLNDSYQCGQSFRQDHANISGAGFYVDPSYGDGSSGTVTLSIFSAYNSGSPTGLIASGSAANVNRNSGWMDVFFNPAAVTVGNQYYLIIQSSNSIVASYGNASYADGNAVYIGTETGFRAYDLTFRTYYENNLTQVPEPGSVALLGLGIAGLAFARRKKTAR
ncbi:MAG TPA: PEP-CTERM sorting domain-containing protein, partial [Telluria sp.]